MIKRAKAVTTKSPNTIANWWKLPNVTLNYTGTIYLIMIGHRTLNIPPAIP